MSPSGLSACSGAPAPIPLPHGPDGAARRRRARCCRPRSRGHDRQQRYTTGRSPWRRRCPLGSPRPTARPVKDTGSGGGRRRPEQREQRHPRPPRPQRHRRYLARDGRRRRGTAALRLGLYGGGLGPFRLCPQPPSAISAAFFGNLRRGQPTLGNLRSEPLRVFPASNRRTMTGAISATSPQPFRPPSHALRFSRQFPSLSASFFAQLRQFPLLPAGRGVATAQCYRTPVRPQTFLGFIISLAFITPMLPRTSGVPPAKRPALQQPSCEELPRGSLSRKDTLARSIAEGYRRYIMPAQAPPGPFPRRWRSGRALRVGRAPPPWASGT